MGNGHGEHLVQTGMMSLIRFTARVHFALRSMAGVWQWWWWRMEMMASTSQCVRLRQSIFTFTVEFGHRFQAFGPMLLTATRDECKRRTRNRKRVDTISCALLPSLSLSSCIVEWGRKLSRRRNGSIKSKNVFYVRCVTLTTRIEW